MNAKTAEGAGAFNHIDNQLIESLFYKLLNVLSNFTQSTEQLE